MDEKLIWIKMLRTVGEYTEGERYEIDEPTAKAWEKAEACEVLDNNPETELINTFQKRLDERDRSILEKLTEAVKVETPKLPAVAKRNDDCSFGDFAYHVAKKNFDVLTNKYGEKTLSVSSDSALVPTPLAQQVLGSKGFEDTVFAHVTPVKMKSDTDTYAVLDQASVSPSGGQSSFGGGIVGGFGIEDSDATATEPAYVNISLPSDKYTMFAEITLELQQDSIVDLNAELPRKFQQQYVQHMSHFILNGDGSGEPAGVIDHASTIAQTRAVANQISYADVVNMITRKASNGTNWVWIISNSALGELLTLEDSGGNLVYQANSRDAVGRTLMGFPVLVSEHAATLGSSGDLLLCNLQDGYVFGERMDARLSFSDHVSWRKGRRSWKLEARVGGRPTHAGTITLADGSTTVSDLIQLDAATS